MEKFVNVCELTRKAERTVEVYKDVDGRAVCVGRGQEEKEMEKTTQ